MYLYAFIKKTVSCFKYIFIWFIFENITNILNRKIFLFTISFGEIWCWFFRVLVWVFHVRACVSRTFILVSFCQHLSRTKTPTRMHTHTHIKIFLSHTHTHNRTPAIAVSRNETQWNCYFGVDPGSWVLNPWPLAKRRPSTRLISRMYLKDTHTRIQWRPIPPSALHLARAYIEFVFMMCP